MVFRPYTFDPHKLYKHPTMHPYWHHGWHYGRRGGSRLLWFVFGAGAASLWMKHKECHGYESKHCIRGRLPPEAYPAPAQSQAPPPAVPAPAPPADGALPEQPSATQQRRWERWEWHWPPREAQQQAPQQQRQDEHRVLPPLANPSEGWEDETQRLQKMTQQAAERVSVRFALHADPG